jgi:hypothetical protein
VVRLWGVNYSAPFNHNFYNLEELVSVRKRLLTGISLTSN